MRAVYIDRYFMRDSYKCVLTSVSLPILERKRIKQSLNYIANKNILYFNEIKEDNIRTYYNYCNFFMKERNMNSSSLKLNSFRRSEYCRQLFELIKLEYNLYHQEPLRIYIPFNDDKGFLKTLNSMIKKRKMNISIEEIKYDESRLSQLANILSGCVYYHDREDLYELNLGKKGKPQLVAYLYSCKKSKNKWNIKYSYIKT